MAVPGRVVAALVSGTQETSLSLAQLNFDFSLVKLEAPASFHGVGNLLSRKRKAAAESGTTHVTARKLGALFEQLLPTTPLLVDGYGSRASEIAQFSENEEATRSIYGMFADQAGIDATSIWAAATSGTAAIAVHLLACMLAKMFPGPEATSIWAELIEERKKELAREDSYHVAAMLAAQISVPREQLAEWDNSARSWLRVADEVKTVQQTQLLLIIKNIHVPVNHNRGNLYQSVISAWTRALELMENLLRGAAQCVTPYEGNGDLLLALASWHIYPDMDVLGSKKIHQKDHLMPSEAILTVGVECSPAQRDLGVYWSLPLAYFRFYGPPKTAARSLCTDAERVSVSHFRFVVLGSFLSNWTNPESQEDDILHHAEIIVHIYDYLIADQEVKNVGTSSGSSPVSKQTSFGLLKSKPNWLRDLAEASQLLLEADETEKAIYERLIGLGVRRGSRFLDKQPRFFGLESFHDFYDLLNGIEAKIAALRRLAIRIDMHDLNPLIRYRNIEYNENGKRVVEVVKPSAPYVEGDVAINMPGSVSAPAKTENSFLASEDGTEVSPEPTEPHVSAFRPGAEDSYFSEYFDSNVENESYVHFDTDSARKRSISPEESVGVGDTNLPPRRPIPEITRSTIQAAERTGSEVMLEEDTNPKWGHSPADFLMFTETDPDISSGINQTTISGAMRNLPDRFYMYASVLPFDRSSAKRSRNGTEIRYGSRNRWAPTDDCQSLSQMLPSEDISNLTELGLRSSLDERIDMLDQEEPSLTMKLGDSLECALFTTGEPFQVETTLDDFAWALENDAFDRDKLAWHLSFGNESNQDNDRLRRQRLVRCALAAVSMIYAQFPKVTVALKVIERPLRQQKWVRDHSPSNKHETKSDSSGYLSSDQSDSESEFENQFDAGDADFLDPKITDVYRGFFPPRLARSSYFALIAAFETGTLNPDPSSLDQVMAMSAGDSLFVAAQLLADPLESQQMTQSSICRIRGNIGKPGVAMMVPPPELQIRERVSANWQLINHAPFDGELVDSFEGTSLHLCFTEYNRSVDIGIHGVRDADFYFVEAYVQVCFKGKWIGDIDIIAGSLSSDFHIFDPKSEDTAEMKSCRHTAKHVRSFRVVAVDNWDEFIDNPKHGIVVRAKGNWMARLAAANLSTQRKHRTIVLRTTEPICWPCVRDKYMLESSAGETAFIC